MSDVSDEYMVETYSTMDLVMALYVTSIASFCFPHVVEVSALSVCSVCVFVVLSRCFLYAEFLVKRESQYPWVYIHGWCLFIYIANCVLYSVGSGVKSMHVVLSALRMRSTT